MESVWGKLGSIMNATGKSIEMMFDLTLAMQQFSVIKHERAYDGSLVGLVPPSGLLPPNLGPDQRMKSIQTPVTSADATADYPSVKWSSLSGSSLGGSDSGRCSCRS